MVTFVLFLEELLPISLCLILSLNPSSPLGNNKGYCNAMKERCILEIRFNNPLLVSTMISDVSQSSTTSAATSDAVERIYYLPSWSLLPMSFNSDAVGRIYCLLSRSPFPMSFNFTFEKSQSPNLSLTILNDLTNILC